MCDTIFSEVNFFHSYKYLNIKLCDEIYTLLFKHICLQKNFYLVYKSIFLQILFLSILLTRDLLRVS